VVGDIYGNQSNPVSFTYTPTTFTTAEAEFELRTSEFDFEPQVIRIVGSAIPQRLDSQQPFYPSVMEGTEGDFPEESASSVIKRKNRTLLTDKSTRPT